MGESNAVVKPACPYCGHLGWGYLRKHTKVRGETVCYECGRGFYYERVETVSYVTRRLEEGVSDV